MNERDPLDQLQLLADHGERQATALPAGRVRQLGNRRRHRRYGLSLAAAVAVLAIGGGAVLTQTGTGRAAPDPATSPTSAASAGPEPSASPTPADRTLTQPNLITARDLAKPTGSGQLVEWTEHERPVDHVSVCQQPLAALGATAVFTRNFRVTYPNARTADGPLANTPSIYTQALQFGDAQAAEKAVSTYRDWVSTCRATIKTDPAYELVSGADRTSWFGVKADDRTIGRFAQVPLYRERNDASENGYFETVGLTVVRDRLMVTVEVLYGNEKHTSYQQGGDSESGLPEDIQFSLIRAAAQRLAR